jgi:hypothetical protein
MLGLHGIKRTSTFLPAIQVTTCHLTRENCELLMFSLSSDDEHVSIKILNGFATRLNHEKKLRELMFQRLSESSSIRSERIQSHPPAAITVLASYPIFAIRVSKRMTANRDTSAKLGPRL